MQKIILTTVGIFSIVNIDDLDAMQIDNSAKYSVQETSNYQKYVTDNKSNEAPNLLLVGALILVLGITSYKFISKSLVRKSSFTPVKTITSLNQEDKHKTIESDINLYIQQAYQLHHQGELSKALNSFDTALTIYPHNAYLYSERANFRFANLGDKLGAIADYNEAIRLNPQAAIFYVWRSRVYYALGNHQQAISDYNEAMRLSPEETMLYCFSSTSNAINN